MSEQRAHRILYMSGSIGLGHAGRDVAIARELRRLRPEIEIDWLAGDPARRLIEEAGERVLPASDAFQETGAAEARAGEFSLNIISYLQRAAGAWARAARTSLRAMKQRPYDLVVGDETYEVSVAFSLRPALKTVPFAIIYDFLGLDAMTRNPRERLTVHVTNRIWGGGHRGRPPQEDLVLFVGEPEDVDDRPLGLRLPNRREYARRYYQFVGYAFPFDPGAYADRAKVRAALGYDERPPIVCSVGGTAVGGDLLRLCASAYPRLVERVPDARMVLVGGPRVDPATLQAPAGVEVRGYVPRLYEHFAACDVAVVQAGGTTTLELTALRRPFLYFPLEGHLEQNLVVARRLARHRAGQRLDYSHTAPDRLAQAIADQLGNDQAGLPSRAMEPNGRPPSSTDCCRKTRRARAMRRSVGTGLADTASRRAHAPRGDPPRSRSRAGLACARRRDALAARPTRHGRPLSRSGAADLLHPRWVQRRDPLDQLAPRDRREVVEAGDARARQPVRHIQLELVGEAPNGCRERHHDHFAEPLDRFISGQDDVRAASVRDRLAPPDLAAGRAAHQLPSAARSRSFSRCSACSASSCVWARRSPHSSMSPSAARRARSACSSDQCGARSSSFSFAVTAQW
jgi:UDP:flavonoid glycosyltransferase YjiC (YdhE family)